jgi:hypothetical protein
MLQTQAYVLWWFMHVGEYSACISGKNPGLFEKKGRRGAS